MAYIFDKDTERVANLTKLEQQIISALPIFGVSDRGVGLSELARLAKIPRTTLPRNINKLMKRRFVVTGKNGRRTRYFENVKNALQLTPSVSKTEMVRTLHGYKNVISIFEQLVTLSPHDRVAGIQPDRSVHNAFKKIPLKYLLKFNKQIKSKGLIIEGIVHEKSVETVVKHFGPKDSKKVLASFVGRLEDYAKIPDEFADVSAEIYLFKNSAYIINWDSETAIEITDQSMSRLFKAMFDCVKSVATRYSQSEKMKKYL